ncbi:MAG TPA: COX15/CtaA family protein [Phycisphaerales bacterium]|nr:COX15/CtaA family protein [Phycisphaerales bacterium]
MSRPVYPVETQGPTALWPSRLAASVTIGFAATVAMWVVWFLTNLPGVQLHASVSGPALLLTAGTLVLIGAVRLPRNDRLVVGALAGLVAGLANLLALGSQLTAPTNAGAAAPGAEGLKPGAGLIVIGFLVTMCVTGLVAGFGARSLGGNDARRSARDWYGTFAFVNAWAILPLIALGGLVTSARAGFAVPDWPGTYGANMLLYPLALMSEPRIFLEHSHRLFGMMVGLTTTAGFVLALCYSGSGRVKLGALGLLLLVIAQGVVGGFWTQDKALWMVIAHGIAGQVFFALACAHAASVSPGWLRWTADPSAVGVATPRKGAAVLLALLVVQLTMGAMVRHMGSRGAHALYTHIALAMVILVLASIVGVKMLRLKSTPVHGKGLRLAGHNVTMAVGLQVLLGGVALVAWVQTKDAVAPLAAQLGETPMMKPWTVLVRTAHQANGALVLGSSAVLAMWALARRRA